MFLTGLSIIIPTKDRGEVFRKTLAAAYHSTENILSEIIIVNDSKTKTPVIAPNYKDRVTLINNPKSGVASARNLGAEFSRFQTLLFLDDDILISPDNIAHLSNIITSHPQSAINLNWTYPTDLTEQIRETQFGRYLFKNGFTSLKGWSSNLKWNDDKIFEVDFIASYFLCIKKEQFNEIGRYNESFPHAGAEDFEFATRLKKSNISGLCDPQSIVLHNEEDRSELRPWLERKERSAETRKVAVNMGHTALEIKSSTLKIKIIHLIYNIKEVLFLILRVIPNHKSFDVIYFKITNILMAAYLYQGYFKIKKP
ncbi:MAG: glycosyl transferase family 2 [Bacteroidetes bacterium]|nr:glycosyl transferase family 2 [Bacteroidota bacterium]